MNDRDQEEIRELLEELQRLQLRQTFIIGRVQGLEANRGTPRLTHRGPAYRATDQLPREEVITRPTAPVEFPSVAKARHSAPKTTNKAPPNQRTPAENPDRQFQVGDRVRVTNPKSHQQPIGVITRLGNHHTVTARNGSEIHRAAKNLRLLHHE